MTQPATTLDATTLDATTDAALQGQVFQAVLFDMDGTLVDSTAAVNRSWLRWGAEAGLGPSYTGAEHGVPARQQIAALVAEDLVEASVARLTEFELADADGVTILAGAAELMAGIPEARRAIVTSCGRQLCLMRLDAAGFSAPLTVVTIDDTSRGKPVPEPFLLAAERLGVDPSRCVVVEDAPAGLAAARAAGCATIGVVGTHRAAELEADLVVSGLDRLRVSVQPDGVVFHLVAE